MKSICIHESGQGADKLRVISYGNGMSYAVQFGESGVPMRDLYFQGDDATELRDEFETLESSRPDELSRDHWLAALDPYL